MKLVDANVLLYAVNEADAKHAVSNAWLDESLHSTETIGFAWIVLLAFLRLATKPVLFPRPLEVTTALTIVRGWLAQPASVVVQPTARHLDVLAGLLVPHGTGGNLTSDAHLAALAVEYDATVITHDADFGRFAGVVWRSPASDDR